MIQELEHFINIDRFITDKGWMAMNILGNASSPDFTYTVGLQHSCQHPELIIFGLGGDTHHAVLSELIKVIQSGEALKFDTPYKSGLANDVLVYVQNVPIGAFKTHLKHARVYNDLKGKKIDGMAPIIRGKKLKQLRAYQVVWPDMSGLFPWEDGFDARYWALQPLLNSVSTRRAS